jgi:hypothetical protein
VLFIILKLGAWSERVLAKVELIEVEAGAFVVVLLEVVPDVLAFVVLTAMEV